MMHRLANSPILVGVFLFAATRASAGETVGNVDFNHDIRPILSTACFTCHGPDANQRESGLRLDIRQHAIGEADSGARAIVPGDVEQSELLRRVVSADDDERMPPRDSGKRLSAGDVELLTQWIRQGAPYAKHWSYVKPRRPATPRRTDLPAKLAAWPKNDIDYFILDRLLNEGMTPLPEADRYALARRVSLDLTGLPPTVEEVDAFVNDDQPQAYERLVDRLLAKTTYGEHWARLWLDLARYADSAGYADDPPRTIWAYRDWVIDALNQNMPFDQFTIEQIAGDLLPNPTNSQLVATAFHRNTMTNNEGGTDDEEFRNVAIVDRVNTTMAVWMGTTIACCQCHDHKYDPITQREFFGLFAIFNNTQDKDLRDESPLVELWSDEQRKQRRAWRNEIAILEQAIDTPTPELAAAQQQWAEHFFDEPPWKILHPSVAAAESGASPMIADDHTVSVPSTAASDVYHLEIPLLDSDDDDSTGLDGLTALQIEAIPSETIAAGGPGHAAGGFVVTRVLATVVPPTGETTLGRYVRLENTGEKKILSLAEVQVFDGEQNLAPGGKAKQSSTAFGGKAGRAIDGNTNGEYTANSTTHTNTESDPWWELDLQSPLPIQRIVLWNRTDGQLHTRLNGFSIVVLDENRQQVWSQFVDDPPNPSREYSVGGARDLVFSAAHASYEEHGFEAENVLNNKFPNALGWGVTRHTGNSVTLTLVPRSPVKFASGSTLKLTIEQLSPEMDHTLGSFRVSATDDSTMGRHVQTPVNIISFLKKPPDSRTDAERMAIGEYYRSVSPKLRSMRDRLARLKQQVAEMKPYTTVPIMRALAKADQRTTRIQRRGNFLEKGAVVEKGVPAAFHSLPEGVTVDRLALARWLVDENNPLTSRVIANRYWEAIFGRGIVPTSEEFGSQGEPPSHSELLDWLATELQRVDWDTKALLKTIVLSATYRQSSRVTPETYQRDPDNVLLARGPRFRLSAEMIRDQALSVSGLLSPKIGGPPVKPPQPSLGVRAAFGGGIDWKTSAGEDRYRRALYTMWRRSNPYPSMATFDAPSREVCTIRRATTNTPLQALVTLNDPVYVEAAQALARRMLGAGTTVEERARRGFRICVARPPEQQELDALVQLYEQAKQRFAADEDSARKFVENLVDPSLDKQDKVDAEELAAWSVVGNVLLNLDEMIMKR